MPNQNRSGNAAPAAPAAPAAVPSIYIHTKPLELRDDGKKSYFDYCLKRKANALPYANEEDAKDTYTGLIYEYDNNFLLKIQDTTSDIRRDLEAKLNSIAVAKNCNIVMWISENTYCTRGHAEFDPKLREILTTRIPRNNLLTVGILIACGSDKTAWALNQARAGSPSFLVPNTQFLSQQPVFLGFNGQVHPYFSDFMICKEGLPSHEFPTRICAVEKSTSPGLFDLNNDTLAVQASGVDLLGLGNIITTRTLINLPSNQSSPRLQCCKSTLKDFPNYFIQGFKSTERKCMRLDWEKVKARVENIKGKVMDNTPITEMDSTIRGIIDRPPAGYEVDGTKCMPIQDGNQNPCNIADNIIRQENYIEAEHFMSLQDPLRKKWGQLLNDLKINKGRKFDSIFDSLSEEEKFQLIDVKANDIPYQQFGETALFRLLNNPAALNREDILKKLLKYNPSTNFEIGIVYQPNEYKSIAMIALKPEQNNILDTLLRNSTVDIVNDSVLQRLRERNVAGELDMQFKKHMRLMLKDIMKFIERPNPANSQQRRDLKKQKVIQLFERVGTTYNVNFFPLLEVNEQSRDDATRTVAEDYRILEVLRRKERRGNTEKNIYELLKEALRQINANPNQNQNIFIAPAAPAAPAAQGGRRKRTSRTKKNRRTKRRQTRRR